MYEVFQEQLTASPTFAYSGLDAMASEYQIGAYNPKDGENGFFGFALGFNEDDTFNPDARFLLVDWKRGAAKGGNQGIRLSLVNGIPGLTDANGKKG